MPHNEDDGLLPAIPGWGRHAGTVVVQQEGAEARYEGGPLTDQLHMELCVDDECHIHGGAAGTRRHGELPGADLLAAERARRGTREQTRSLSVRAQAVLVLRWFLDGTRMSQLARDNQVSKSTGYDYLHEGIDVLAARAAEPATGR